uniref:Venom peptide Ht205 n=1 Tax=Hadogenes troglodytes TaxID=1577150 RepID=A0A1B3IJ86_9SCOR|nr:venom peptide Ht205 [Hadogenes troglodytes]
MRDIYLKWTFAVSALFVFILLGIGFSIVTVIMAYGDKNSFPQVQEVHIRILFISVVSGAGMAIGVFAEIILLVSMKS